MKLKLSEYLKYIILLLITIGIVTYGIYGYIKNTNFKKNGIETNANITKINTLKNTNYDLSCTVYISYNVNNVEYSGKLFYYRYNMSVGDKVAIYHDQSSPNTITTSYYYIGYLVFSAFGLIVLIFVIKSIVKRLDKVDTKGKLIKNGKMVEAIIESVKLNSEYDSKDKKPYIIVCKWIDKETDKTYFFESKEIWFDPKSIINERKITKLPVYMDIKKLTNYYVCLNSILKNK